MEPITTTAIITLVTYLGSEMLKKSFETATEEFSKEGVAWLKSIFFRSDDTPKDAIIELKNDPSDGDNIKMAEVAINKSLKNNPANELLLKEMYEVIKAKEAKGEFTGISNSKNVNTGTITAGGSVIFGDSNNSAGK